MVKPVEIYIGGSELLGYTEMTLKRTKDAMTGSFSASIFMGYVPTEPVLIDVAKGNELQVKIGGHLAFTGSVDKRIGTGAKSGREGTAEHSGAVINSRSVSIGPDSYTVKITSRGKTKYLIDSSHQHPTTNMLQPTNREAVERLISPWKIKLEWMSATIKLDKVRFRDGARVVDELNRVATENGHFLYETRDGSLRFTDSTGGTVGEALILGKNILTFSAEQNEDQVKSRIKVKGQRTKKEVWGEAATVTTYKEIEDTDVGSLIPIIVQHYGDGTPEALERRARFEANKRSSASKTVTVEVFHVQQSDGSPWDIGTEHYVEIPPEGIFDVFECTALTYTVQNDKTLKTTLTLSPLPASAAAGFAAGLSTIGLDPAMGSARKAIAGVTFAAGKYPAPWSSPSINVIEQVTFAGLDAVEKLAGLKGL